MSSRKVQRTFNYLDRHRIPASDIDIEARLNAKGQSVAIIRQIKLPPASETAHDPERWRKAEVCVEVWRGRSANWHRIKLGPVGELDRKLRNPHNELLPGFEAADDITYRVKVVAADTQLLLAEAERIRSSNEEDKPGATDELIRVRKEPSLEEQPWRLDWSDDDGGPVVLVSSRLRDCEAFFTRDAAFVAAMVPQIMREVLFRLALDSDLREPNWAQKWLEFAARFDETELPQSGQWREAQLWADEVVQTFCNRESFVAKANKALLSASAAA